MYTLAGWAASHPRALAWWQPPAGRVCWMLRLLADKLVELGQVDAVSPETIRRVPKKRPQAAVALHSVVPNDRALGQDLPLMQDSG
jgi:hypothetical protein